MPVNWVAKCIASSALLMVAACAEEELILPGEREPLRPDAVEKVVVNRVQPLDLPAPQRNADWTHKASSPSHSAPHLALRQPLSLAWAADIGTGEGKRSRLSADPVIAEGRVYTMDAEAQVTAFDLAGRTIWTQDLTPPNERSDEGLGGGLAYADGMLYVTSGFGRLVALDPATGAQRWDQRLDTAVSAAPTISDGTAYIAARNGTGWAIDTTTGRILWQIVAGKTDRGLFGGPSPVIAGDLVVFPFATGQMVAADRATGNRRWLASVAGARDDRVFSQVRDLTGDPVVVGEILIAGSHGGRTSAFDIDGGAPLWTAEEGAMSPVIVAAGSVFLVSDTNRLVRLDLETGEIIWRVDLPLFTRERASRIKGTYAHFGPVLAGGRLLVLSDDGYIRSFDPASGALISAEELPSGAARNPVISNGTLYVVTENGRLNAFR